MPKNSLFGDTLMKRTLIVLASLLILLWLLGSSLLFVDASEFVYVTQFGRHIATYDGQAEAGLHVKAPWPFQSVLRIDRRLQVFDLPTQELLIRDQDEPTGEPKSLPLTFDVYVCWRIPGKSPPSIPPTGGEEGGDPVDRFVRSFGTAEAAQRFLRSQIISRLKVELSDVPLAELVNTDASKLKTHVLFQNVRESLLERARSVGVEVVDIRLRRFNHPVQVREETFAKIRGQRKLEADNYRRQGERMAAKIRAEGELEAKQIRTKAESDKTRLEGDARAEATHILNEAHKQAPEFYRFVRLMEASKKMFADDKTQLILSLDHPLAALLKEMPKMNTPAGNGEKGEKAKR